MSTALSTLSKLFTARRRAPQPLEAADMGTCFGLEMSLGPAAAGEPELESARVARLQAAATKTPVRRWHPWRAKAARRGDASAGAEAADTAAASGRSADAQVTGQAPLAA